MVKLSRREFAAGSVVLPSVSLASPEEDPKRSTMLSGVFPLEKLGGLLLPRDKWKPYPDAADRAAWEGLPADLRKGAIEGGEANLKAEWPALPATLALEYKRNGNRSHFEGVRNIRREKLRALVTAECVENKGRFLDDIANGIWTTCEETFWGIPAHLSAQKASTGLPDAAEPIIDLFAAETSAQLAWIDYLLGGLLDKVSPLLRKRILLEMDRRILTPYFEREDFGWMGLKHTGRVNNWNPWINSNCLASSLLMERDPKRRTGTAHKILRSLDRFMASYYDDGGCDEGPGYWHRAGASLFDCLELYHSATNGAVNFYNIPLVREMGRYVYRAHIYNDWFTNFADAPAQVHLEGDLVYRYGKRIGDEKMQQLGAWATQKDGLDSARGGSFGRQLPAMFNLAALRKAPASQSLVRDVWMSGIQVMTARMKAGSPEGLYLAVQGGHNAESHNHNDVGNFIVFANGEPAIIDVGVETYTAKTFSSKRYEIWTMQSAYHNLPTIDGMMQAAGREYEATEVGYKPGDNAVEYNLNIAKAWPSAAGIDFWKRRFVFDRAKNQIEVAEDYSLKKAPGKITLTLMTPCPVKQSGPGELTLAGRGVKALFDGKVLTPTTEEIKITDSRLLKTWGQRLYRTLLTADKPPAKGAFSVRIVQGA